MRLAYRVIFEDAYMIPEYNTIRIDLAAEWPTLLIGHPQDVHGRHANALWMYLGAQQ